MGSDFNWDVVIRLATQGAKSSVSDLNLVADAQDRLNKEGKITEKGLDSNTKAIGRYSRAAQEGTGSNDRMAASTNALRYANYDLATTLFTVAGAITAVGAATTIAFASQESAFTTVERIVSGTSAEITELRSELQGLSTEIPESFQSLSSIASLGSALGIEATNIAKFTEVVAKFSATTGVSTEAAATGFGKLAQYLNIGEESYDNLGSAILKAGNISVATEEQVLKFSQALALPAARAGLLTDQVVALGATIASFGNINVEGAGSALSRIFANIDRDVAEGGDGLERFAKISGNTASQFGIAWKTNAGDTFNEVIRGLAGDVDNLVANMDALGIVNERDRRVVSALAINYDKYKQILGETTAAWREGIYMNEAYGLVLDDLSSKWTIFLNAVTNAAAAVGSSVAPAMKSLLDTSTDLLVAFAGFAESDLGGVFFRLVAGIAVAVAAWAALRGITALATASTLAFRFATQTLSGPGIIAGLRGLGIAMGFVKTNADGATVSTVGLRVAMISLLRATVVLGLLQAIGAALFDLRQAGLVVIDVFSGLARSVVAAARIAADAIGQLPGGGIFKEWANGLQVAYDEIGNFNSTAKKEWGNFSEDMGWVTDDLMGLNQETVTGTEVMEDYGESLADTSGDVGNLGNAAGDAAQQVRTLTDYASDLASVWSRAFEIRFSSQSTLDSITTAFLDIRDASEEARRNIARLEAEVSGIQSDLNIQNRFLSIAIEYQDADRAQAIQANIAQLQADLAEKTADLSDEQAKNSKTLVGNSKAALSNRDTIESLVEQYQAHISALAASGVDSATLLTETARLKAEFIAQATQLGYNRSELNLYAAAFDDVALAIANVPRNITVTANANPALQALNEFFAKASSMASQGINVPINTTGGADQGSRDALFTQWATNAQKQYGMALAQSASGWAAVRAMWERGVYGQFYEGGFTGSGGKYEPAGVVHRGEYVVPKKDVNQRTGLPYADALGRLQKGMKGRSGYAGGGFVGPPSSAGGHISSFGPMAYQQLQNALRNIVALDGQVISQNSSENYARGTNEGNN